MSSRFRASLLLLIVSVTSGAGVANAAERVLRVCSDPNNLPFSNQAQQGFENRIAELVAKDLNARLEYTWWSQRKSFIHNSLDQHRCDVLIGIPAALDLVLTTRPYYRSTYVFVARRDRNLHLSSLSDPRLSGLRIGVHVVGDDYVPPASALARRGLSGNLIGFSLFGAYEEQNPASELIQAVANGKVDIALAWGPLAGYFAQLQKQPLEVLAVSPPVFMAVPFTFDISMGVRKGDEGLRAELDHVLDQECAAIQAVLDRYGVPQSGEGKPQCESSQQRSGLLP